MNTGSAADDVLDEHPQRAVTWTTVNAAEAAFPDVPTPLSWSWSWWPTESGIRGCFAGTGAFPRTFARPPTDLADRILTIHQGHVAINLDLFRELGDRLPGGSGDDIERSFFGSVRAGVTATNHTSRYPVVALKLPRFAVASRRALRGFEEPIDQWWRRSVALSRPDLPAAQALLSEAQRRYAGIAVPHVAAGLVSQALYDRVRAVSSTVGLQDQVGLLVPGGQAEARWLAELWDVAHSRQTLATFLDRHGYHGPFEGELSSPSWRIDPSPLERLLAIYAREADREPPAALAQRRGIEMRSAEKELLSALPARQRPSARLLLAAARSYMPLRESGRATFLRAYDVARHAAGAAGRHLASGGRLERDDDVFYLTFDELTAPVLRPDAREVTRFRRARREHYRTLALPNLWTGSPIAQQLSEPPADGEQISGQGVSAGICEGRVRVVLDPADVDDLDEGDVLVCRATDPSWAALFYLVSAVVIDIGGEMSHGAIVARELGLPAVVNTHDGTRRLQSGERVRVDGSAGTVVRIP